MRCCAACDLTLTCDECACCVPRFLCATGTVTPADATVCCREFKFRLDAQRNTLGSCVWFGFDRCLELTVSIVKVDSVCYTKVESPVFPTALLFVGLFPAISFNQTGTDGNTYVGTITKHTDLAVNPLADKTCSECCDVPCVTTKVCVKLKLDAAPISGFPCDYPPMKELFLWDCASLSWIGSPFVVNGQTYTVTIVLVEEEAPPPGPFIDPILDIRVKKCVAKAHIVGPNGVDFYYYFHPLAQSVGQDFPVYTGETGQPANALIGHISFSDGACACRVFATDCRWGCPGLRFRLTQCDPPVLSASVINPGCSSDGLSWLMDLEPAGPGGICHNFTNRGSTTAPCCAINLVSYLSYTPKQNCNDVETIDVEGYRLHLVGVGTCRPDGMTPYSFDITVPVDVASSSCDPVVLNFPIAKSLLDPASPEIPIPCCDGTPGAAFVRITL